MVDPGGPSDQGSPGLHDAQLMARVSQGDVAAFDEIAGRYWRTTFLYVYHLVHDREKASDVTQEAFTRLWEQRTKWRPTGSLAAWLLRVARNVVINDRRRWRLHMQWRSTTSREDLRGPRTPLQDTEAIEVKTALQEAIDTLPPRRREVFLLFHLQDLSHREIGEILGIRPQTVANHLHDAVLELRGTMKRFRSES
jgi:RNA polymerase sigma-70 factor, ECF subfamily